VEKPASLRCAAFSTAMSITSIVSVKSNIQAAVFVVNCFLDILWVPHRIIFDERIQDDEKFSHTGGDNNFERFALCFQPFRKRSDDGVEAFGGESSHVQDATHWGASAADGAFAMKASAVTIERRQSSQGGNFLAVEQSQFREFGQERTDCDCSDAGNGSEDIPFVCPMVVGFEQLGDLFVEGFDLLVEQRDHLLQTLLDDLGGGKFLPVFFGRSEVDQLSASCDELLQFLLFFVVFGDGSGTDVLSEAGDHACVDPVSFGEDTEAFGEVSDLAGIDDGDQMSRGGEIGDEPLLIPACGFDDDQAGSRLGQELLQMLKALCVIGERVLRFLRKETQIERVFGDVDADKGSNRAVHGAVPVLRMRARCNAKLRSALAAVRAKIHRPATTLLCDGLWGPGHDRSAAGRRGKACFATLRSLFHGNVHYINCFS